MDIWTLTVAAAALLAIALGWALAELYTERLRRMRIEAEARELRRALAGADQHCRELHRQLAAMRGPPRLREVPSPDGRA